jgi:acylaminoacyl-peptidase
LKAAVLHCNYRGSTGFGQDAVESLTGNIGKNDVEDCMKLVKMCISQGVINEDKITVVGGSHGGFLAAHLIGQHPNVFKAAALRNPVWDIPSMVGVTDIPDWCYVESCGVGAYDFSSVSSPSAEGEVMSNMMRTSPSRYVDAINAPCLICLGMKDRRVPASQGVLMYHMLRARGVHSELMTFPEDVHAIDRPASEAEHWCAIAEFLGKYL